MVATCSWSVMWGESGYFKVARKGCAGTVGLDAHVCMARVHFSMQYLICQGTNVLHRVYSYAPGCRKNKSQGYTKLQANLQTKLTSLQMWLHFRTMILQWFFTWGMVPPSGPYVQRQGNDCGITVDGVVAIVDSEAAALAVNEGSAQRIAAARAAAVKDAPAAGVAA
eukprot:1160130-Pelagomonas_calceolata.AAC.3